MIELNVKQIAESKGITTPKELARRCGFHRNIAGELLRHRTAPFSRLTIERLCAGLQVTPAELFVTEPVTDELPEEARRDHQTPKIPDELDEAARKTVETRREPNEG